MNSNRNNKFREISVQIVLLIIVSILFWFIIDQVNEKLDRKGISTGFDFLWAPSGYDLSESVIPYDGSKTYAHALLAGFLNTLKVALLAIFASITLGFLAAMAQISENKILSKIVKLYVGVVRNTPLLLQLFFWFGIFTSLPSPRKAYEPISGVYISNRGISFPMPDLVTLLLIIVALFTLILGIRTLLKSKRTFNPNSKIVSSAFFTISILLLFYIWRYGEFILPEAGKFSISGGGKVSPEFLTIFTGLSFYTGTYIAEAIRGAIDSIPQGQIEAAKSMGLSSSLVLLLIVIPQATRIAMPAVVSELLNLVKNSSLGVAVGYPDLVSAGNTAMNQTGQAIELIAIYMLIYVTINYIITKLFNIWEQRYDW